MLRSVDGFWGSRTAGGYTSRWQIHLKDLAMRRQGELAILGLQAINVNRSIGRLSSDKLIERIPRYALDVVRVLCDLPYHLPYGL